MEHEKLTSDQRGNRTLATVVFTDCVGFSARMSVDEDHTLDLIRRDMQLMKQLCEDLEGRVLKSTGDGLLMCFSSAVKAVECAIVIQKTIAERAEGLQPNDALSHRIGIHLADIFISDTDVMGNGVNIAARLQTEADPGGICISQTVYDVAKHGLQFDTIYLGPRDLKNIREVVPAYKILLNGKAALDPYAEVAASLYHSPNLTRVKKLLHYVCKSHWESNLNRIEAMDLKELVQELHQLATTPDRLKGSLDAAIKTLSKPAEYLQVAEEVRRSMRLLYVDQPNPTYSGVATPTIQVVFAEHYEQVASQLQQSDNLLRIQKLLFYICYNRWESDPNQLGQARLAVMVQTLHQLAPELDQLNQLIRRYVLTLNKQAEYWAVAQILLDTLEPLYSEEKPAAIDQTIVSQEPAGYSLEAAQIAEIAAQVATTLDGHAHALRIKKLLLYACRSQWARNATDLDVATTSTLVQELYRLAPTQPKLQTFLEKIVRSLNKPTEYALVAKHIWQQFHPFYTEQPAPVDPTANAIPEPAVPELLTAEASKPTPSATPTHPKPKHSRRSLTLVDARLGILKHTNPLRAKILVFSAIQTLFTFSYQDWLNLKQYELDTLLRQLLSTCKIYTDLELLLFDVARQLQDPQETVQAAEVVIKYLRPFYIYGSPALLPAPIAEATQIELDEFEETTMEFTDLYDDADYTRQVISSSEEKTTINPDEPISRITQDPGIALENSPSSPV